MDKKRMVALYLEAKRIAGDDGILHAANHIRKETRNEYVSLDALEKTPAVQEYLRQQHESEPEIRAEDGSELQEYLGPESEDAFSDSGTSPPEPVTVFVDRHGNHLTREVAEERAGEIRELRRQGLTEVEIEELEMLGFDPLWDCLKDSFTGNPELEHYLDNLRPVLAVRALKAKGLTNAEIKELEALGFEPGIDYLYDSFPDNPELERYLDNLYWVLVGRCPPLSDFREPVGVPGEKLFRTDGTTVTLDESGKAGAADDGRVVDFGEVLLRGEERLVVQRDNTVGLLFDPEPDRRSGYKAAKELVVDSYSGPKIVLGMTAPPTDDEWEEIIRAPKKALPYLALNSYLPDSLEYLSDYERTTIRAAIPEVLEDWKQQIAHSEALRKYLALPHDDLAEHVEWETTDFSDTQAIEKTVAEVEAISKLPKKDRKLHVLNKRFAVVTVGSDVVILWERDGRQPLLLNVTSFRNLLANKGKVGKGGQLIANAWLAWHDRRQYLGGLVFKPGEQARADEYNLWAGWGVEPSKEGSCDLFLQHIRDVVCSCNEDDTDWVLDWLAHIFQCPQEKPETVLALQGVPGAGKSIVGKVLKKLLGDTLLATAEANQVTGRFNGHLANCLLLQAEEAFWYRDHHAERLLKNLVTGEYLPIERKGVDVVQMRNFTRLLLTTNKDAVWPTSIDDRRLAIFRVASTHARDRKYFGAMLDQLEDGGYQRLLDFFLSRRIDGDRLFNPPRTAALEEQAAHSLSPEEEWYLDLLTSGELPFSRKTEVLEGGAARVPQAILYASYVGSVQSVGRRHVEPMNDKAFGYFLRKLPGKTSDERVRVYCPHRVRTVQSRWCEFPPLLRCREIYSRRGRGAVQSWDDPEQQWSIESEHGEFTAD